MEIACKVTNKKQEMRRLCRKSYRKSNERDFSGI